MRDEDDVEKPEPGEDQPQMSASEQLRVQTELAQEEEYKRTVAPPGKTRQLLIVMRHGERIDEVCRPAAQPKGSLKWRIAIYVSQLRKLH
jgi:hypothetical protein